jgi:hypothetical protein
VFVALHSVAFKEKKRKEREREGEEGNVSEPRTDNYRLTSQPQTPY